jgi:hypothetical protein
MRNDRTGPLLQHLENPFICVKRGIRGVNPFSCLEVIVVSATVMRGYPPANLDFVECPPQPDHKTGGKARRPVVKSGRHEKSGSTKASSDSFFWETSDV